MDGSQEYENVYLLFSMEAHHKCSYGAYILKPLHYLSIQYIHIPFYSSKPATPSFFACKYAEVVVIFEWPSATEMVFISACLDNKVVAKQCLIQCGEPASIPIFLMSFLTRL